MIKTMTKRELIDNLEMSDIPDDIEVLVGRFEEPISEVEFREEGFLHLYDGGYTKELPVTEQDHDVADRIWSKIMNGIDDISEQNTDGRV